MGRSGQGGGWLGAHGSQIIDQVRVTLGEFASVSASLPNVSEPARLLGRGRLRRPLHHASGAVGTLQSTSGDWGPPIMVTRVVGSGR